MSGEPEDVIEPVDAGQVEGGAAEGGEPEALNFEDRALTMGWTPKEQFKGDPAKWVDAETFVKRGEEFLPFLKATNKRLEKQLSDLQRDVKRFAEFHSKTEQRAYERAVRDLETRQAEAAAAGDVEAVREITAEMVDLAKEVRPNATQDSGGAAEAFDDWIAENGWFNTDRALKGAAIAIADELAEAGVVDPVKQLAAVTKRIKAEFPHKFENPRRREPGAVEAGAAKPAKAGETRSDLPPEARSTMDRWVKQGLITEAQYIKDYFA